MGAEVCAGPTNTIRTVQQHHQQGKLRGAVDPHTHSTISSSSAADSSNSSQPMEHPQQKPRSKLLSAFRKLFTASASPSWLAGLAPTPELGAAAHAAYAELVQGAKLKFSKLYSIGHVLGSGHYARVHLATSLQDGSQWAVKVLHKPETKAKAREQLQKVVKEVAVMRLLQDHPSAVQLHQVLQDSKNYYLVMENCSGGELFDYAYKLDRLPEAEAAHYMAHLASFMAHAHAKGIVHRDIKPENMLLAPELPQAGAATAAAAAGDAQQQQQQWRLKVVDYGCSAFILPGQQLHDAVGTVCYVAPEVLSHSYDAQSDVWSAGVVLFMLLCGYLPFDGSNNEETLTLVRTGDFEMDPEDWGHVSQEGQDLVKLLLTYKPAERPTAAQLLQHSWVRHRAAAAAAAAAGGTAAAAAADTAVPDSAACAADNGASDTH